jgi:hypothetical protein
MCQFASDQTMGMTANPIAGPDRSEPATACWNTGLPAAQPVRSALMR